jgi:hypothetical protein
MRFRALALALLGGLASGAGCQGDGGAVSVRWRIMDLSTGQAWDANDKNITYHDVCCRADLDPKKTCASSSWVVDGVHVSLRDPSTGVPITLTDRPQAPCSARELTSKFDLPTGTFAITLDPDSTDVVPPVTPAPQLRDVVRGAVVNMDVVEIGVDPLPRPLPTPDAGVTQ